jgi:hypothetical protein
MARVFPEDRMDGVVGAPVIHHDHFVGLRITEPERCQTP